MSTASKRPRPDATTVERDIATLEAMDDAAIDTSDSPEVLDWRHAEVGRFYRPVKHSVTIRLDADVLAWFKSQDG